MKNTICIALLFLFGCGGGGDDDGDTRPVTTTEAQGFYRGVSDDKQAIVGIILEDGTFYVVYNSKWYPDIISGMVQGVGVGRAASFTSQNGLDYYFSEPTPVTVSANFVNRQSIAGSINYQDGSGVVFSASYDSNYENTPSLADIAGTYEGETMFLTSPHKFATVSISGSGALSGIDQYDCTMTGTVTPRASGNVYDATVAHGTGCSSYSQQQQMTGIAYLDKRTGQLVSTFVNQDRSASLAFFGVKQ